MLVAEAMMVSVGLGVMLGVAVALGVTVLLGVALQFAVIYVPKLQPFFHTQPLSGRDVLISVAISALPFVVIEIWKQIDRRK